jgi:hypothetical protein
MIQNNALLAKIATLINARTAIPILHKVVLALSGQIVSTTAMLHKSGMVLSAICAMIHIIY